MSERNPKIVDLAFDWFVDSPYSVPVVVAVCALLSVAFVGVVYLVAQALR